ncbi:MAG: nitroreductase family protein [Candidatus Bathyarchaeia archaeon]
MEDLLTLMKKRRSIRKFTPQEIPMKEIDELLEAARWAPSAGNSQPWQFIVVTDREVVESIKMISPGLFGEPPALIVICLNEERVKTSGGLHYIDLGAALQNLLLLASFKGLGCCPIASFDAEALVELLSLPRTIQPVLLVIVGYPDQKPSPPTRLPLDDLILRRF